eukprot:6490806-Amphidinium_carterae.1
MSLSELLATPALAGDGYASYGSVSVAYPVVASQIVPALPPLGRAAQVDICSLVSASTRAWLLDPSLMLLPPEEFPCPLPSASVLVESASEFDAVVRECFIRGLMEPTSASQAFQVRGRPLLNGLFGVHKKFLTLPDGHVARVLRLITNLIPCNALLKPYVGASQRMGYAPLWSQIHLESNEVLLLYSEDQSNCFHLYSMPPVWRSLFVIGRQVSPWVFDLPDSSQPVFPRLCVVPMGFTLSVDLIQEAHETLLRWASLMDASVHCSRLIRLRHLFPPAVGPHAGDFHSCYVDNWDQLCVSLRAVAVFGQESTGQQAVRQAYRDAHVLRDPAKSVQGQLSMVSLGTEVDGDRGLVSAANAKRREVILLGCYLLSLQRVSPALLRSFLGRLVHTFEFCRPLMSVLQNSFQVCLSSAPFVTLSSDVSDELLAALALVPLARSDLRRPFFAHATCSDASPSGGGSCQSLGLTEAGVALLSRLELGLRLEVAPLLLVTVCDPLASFRSALALLDLVPSGFLSFEPSRPARRCMRLAWKDVFHVPFASWSSHLPLSWRQSWSHVTQCCLCSYLWPSALLHAQFPMDLERFLLDVLRAVQGVPDWSVSFLFVVHPAVFSSLSSSFRALATPFVIDTAAFSFAGLRPYCFTNLTLSSLCEIWPGSLPRFSLAPPALPPMSFVLASQATRAVHHLRPWPPFQLSSPRSYMSVSSSLVSQRAQNLCAGDAFRMHPSCYELDWLVRDSHGLRWLLPSEQLRVLAISSSYFSSLQKFVGGSILDTARSFCSVASPVPVLALLFSPHFAADPVDPYTLWARLQENELSAPTLEGSWRARFGQSPLAPSHQQSLSLIKHISRAATH